MSDRKFTGPKAHSMPHAPVLGFHRLSGLGPLRQPKPDHGLPPIGRTGRSVGYQRVSRDRCPYQKSDPNIGMMVSAEIADLEPGQGPDGSSTV